MLMRCHPSLEVTIRSIKIPILLSVQHGFDIESYGGVVQDSNALLPDKRYLCILAGALRRTGEQQCKGVPISSMVKPVPLDRSIQSSHMPLRPRMETLDRAQLRTDRVACLSRVPRPGCDDEIGGNTSAHDFVQEEAASAPRLGTTSTAPDSVREPSRQRLHVLVGRKGARSRAVSA